ncbi:MAG: hypothetical protein AB7F88_19315 [Pyrinomonadaceae bacterium]
MRRNATSTKHLVSFVRRAIVSLNTINIPPGGSAQTTSFSVANRGQFSVTVRLRTNSLLGYGGQTTYRAELMRGTTVLDFADRTVSSAFENVTLSYNVANCNQTGTYRIRVRNLQGPNPQPGQAAFNPFVVPSLTPVSGNLSIFGVTQGTTEDRSIPENLEPSGTGGRIKITATWSGLCLPDPAGCKLTFRLRRNGTTMASDNGYAQNAPFSSPSSRMTVNYTVPPNQVSGNWSLQVVGSPVNKVLNVRPNVSFTPVCQN